VSEVLEWLLKGIAQLLIETMIQGTGWLILRPFYQPEEIKPDGCLVTVTGLLFWILVVTLVVVVVSM